MIEKFLAYGRNFCHFLWNSLIWLFPYLGGKNDEYEKDAEWDSGYPDFRNFLHMAEISGVFPKILYFGSFCASEGKLDEYEKDAEFYSGQSDLEISGLR